MYRTAPLIFSCRHVQIQLDDPFDAYDGDTGGNDEEQDQDDWARLISASKGMVDQLRNLLINLAKLETSVGYTQKYFHRVFSEKMLDKELTLLEDQALAGGRKGWRTRAAESIRLVFTIDKHQRAAQAVQAAALAIHLSQPFPVVQRILSSAGDDVAFRQLPLKQVPYR